MGAVGGQVYDVLLLHCARKCQAEVIYTLDRRDFPRLARELAGRIRVPPAVHGVTLPA